TEYEELIRSISNKARSAHAATILFHEPIAPWVQIESEPDYGDAIQKIANQESVVVSDVKQAFDSRKHELLFVKDNVLSARGHKLVAKTLMTTITDLRDKPEWAPVFASAGMDSSPLSHGLKWLVHGASEIGKELVFSIRFAAQGAPYFKALFSVNGEFIEDKRLETSGLQSFRFQIPERFRDKPAVSVSLQTVASPPSKEDEIGSTGIFLPVPVFIESSPAHGARISVAGRSVAQCDEQPSFVVVSIDYRNGFMRAKRNFAYADLDSMVSWLKARPWGSVVAIGSCSEVGASEFKVLSPGFSYLGYSNVPDTNSRVAFIGAAAIGSDTALVAADPNRRIEVRIGGKRLEDYSSFELAKIPEIAFVDSLS
ncbi:MAG: hypothetical protein KDD53_08365, partial [Bdellovibrionales bacterium]|nr:hypothetical protein [Bdellovibrionales bacterium]